MSLRRDFYVIILSIPSRLVQNTGQQLCFVSMATTENRKHLLELLFNRITNLATVFTLDEGCMPCVRRLCVCSMFDIFALIELYS